MNGSMEGGSAISDLSDPIRPQKVAEMFSELYGNQWTEAFEWLKSEAKTEDDRSDRAITRRLLDIIMACNDFCRQEAETQRKGIVSSLMFKQNDQATIISKDTSRKLGDFIKSVAPDLLSSLKCKFSSKEDNTVVKQYKDRCLECCWYASIQSPPLFICAEFTEFDEGCHKGYRTPGHLIDYVVWPALYLDRNGALLSKAVVECCNEKKDILQDEKVVSSETDSMPKTELNNNENNQMTQENEMERKHVARIQIDSNSSGKEPTVTISNNTTNSNHSTYGRQFSLTTKDLESKKSELKETKPIEHKPENKPSKLTNLLDRSMSSPEPTLHRTPSAILDVSPEELEDRKSTLKGTKTPDARGQPKEIGSFNFG